MTEKIKAIMNEADIKNVGFCAFHRVKDSLLECRARERIPKDAKTVIVCVFPYKIEDKTPKNISRYAAVPDYHRVCGKMLSCACELLRKNIDGYKFEWFVDNSPIPEVPSAAAAGLGVVGQNGLLITEKYGSFVFIGEIVTDLEIETKGCEIKHCTNCGICKKLCPKEEAGGVCLSALSQKKGELSECEADLLKKHNIVWGCDICAESCPLNQVAETTYIREFIDGYRSEYNIGEDIKGRAYEWRGEKTVRRNYEINKNR